MRRVVVLGASGSIGQNALAVIRQLPGEFKVAGLSVHTSSDVLLDLVAHFKPDSVAITGLSYREEIASRCKQFGTTCHFGADSLVDFIEDLDFDILLNALVGAAGLLPTISALKKGKKVALANKETLVMAGEIVTKTANQFGGLIIPVDSEHSAIFQCLAGESIKHVKRIILTGSGGPFLNRDEKDFSSISVEEALAHPNWKMGKKITVDSATLMNKGLEIIEAYWLFGLPLEKIDLVIHPQSIIHSLVEFVDGSIKAQLGWPDMKIPIQYALTYPDRRPMPSRKLDFADLGKLTFIEPDFNKFPSLRLATDALRTGGTAAAILNAANEVAVHYFLAGKIPFLGITALIEEALDKIPSTDHPDLQTILEADRRTRKVVEDMIRDGKVAFPSNA